MKFYLASGFRQRWVLRRAAVALSFRGHEVVSSWIWLEDRPDRSDEDWREFAEAIAVRNLTELRLADAVIVDAYGIAPDNNGGVHFELGHAIGASKPVYLIGPRGNTFHWLPQIAWANSWEAFFSLEKMFPQRVGGYNWANHARD